MGLGWEHAGVNIVGVFCLGNIGFILSSNFITKKNRH